MLGMSFLGEPLSRVIRNSHSVALASAGAGLPLVGGLQLVDGA